ncbi:MAG: nucleotidyltransferase domain-containing protein [Actinobacteria bacterium]|nr:nucleotidyltransferase domain-containing protein [Actinomycetota bacterium]MBU4449785.1 nucleotidyltransferase domain-containing protein [Actinomycetota bacterium]
MVFGSKARGDASEDSDIDLIVITKSAGRNLTREIRFIGYDLEIEFNIILSIQVLSEDYINYLRALPTQFIQNVDRDTIAI